MKVGLKACLHEYYPVSDTTISALSDVSEEVNFPSKHIIIRSGEPCEYIYFITKGLVRSYYTFDEKENTLWFGAENDFVTSFYSLFGNGSSPETIQLLENSILLKIKISDFKSLLQSHPDLLQYYIKILEYGNMYWENRVQTQQITIAKERYTRFTEGNKKLYARIPLNILASYLSISPETLSRIRAIFCFLT